MRKISLTTLLFAAFSLSSLSLFAQDFVTNPVLTAVPSLSIAPDARAGGMGDAGVATAPDVYSQYWNPAKYAFSPNQGAVALSYTPWLRKIVSDIALMQAVGYYKLGTENNQALSASLRYFSIGDVNVSNAHEVLGTIAPYEMAIDMAYSRKLSETFAGSVAVRYIRADYSGLDTEGTPGSVFAADIAGYNESYMNIGQSESLLSFGFNISNIGGKISNNDGSTSSFIPTNLKVGTSIMYPLNDVSTLSVSLDLNKLLVPTPPQKKEEESDNEYQARITDYLNGSSIGGIFKSFGDAPGGFSEEMKEITWSLGVEYDYDSKFRLRGGYFHEDKMKGNRQYFAFGTGFKMSVFQLDAAYLLSTAQSNPLDQTLRLSLAFNFDSGKKRN